MTALPHIDGGFACILADPPWSFVTYEKKRTTPHRGGDDHYQTMDYAAMAALPVADVAARDAALFMWVVDSHFDEALALGRAWGFTFKSCAFVWVKERLHGAGQIDLLTNDVPEARISMGYSTRKQTEQCWLFTRGKPSRLDKGVRQIIAAPRREHSRKPDEQYERIERLYAGPRLEMFARTAWPGWTAWGNQTDRFDAPAQVRG